MKDYDELRKSLERTMHDLTGVLPDALDWHPMVIYMLEILDHQARLVGQEKSFNHLLAQLRTDLDSRLEMGSWTPKAE